MVTCWISMRRVIWLVRIATCGGRGSVVVVSFVDLRDVDLYVFRQGESSWFDLYNQSDGAPEWVEPKPTGGPVQPVRQGPCSRCRVGRLSPDRAAARYSRGGSGLR